MLNNSFGLLIEKSHFILTSFCSRKSKGIYPSCEQTAYIERLLGKTDQYANSIASEIVKDMQMATHYPPEIIDIPTAEELSASIDDLVANISTIESGGSGAGSDDTSFLD